MIIQPTRIAAAVRQVDDAVRVASAAADRGRAVAAPVDRGVLALGPARRGMAAIDDSVQAVTVRADEAARPASQGGAASERARLTDEIATIVGKPDHEITELDMRRLGAISQLPAAARPDLPPKASPFGLAKVADQGWLPADDRSAWGEINSLRRWIRSQQVAEDPAVTTRMLADEVAQIVSRADDQITRPDVERLALIASVPPPKNPGLPAPRALSLQQLADGGWPTTDLPISVRRELNNVRNWIHARQLNEDPAVTARVLADEVATIVAKANDQITQQDLNRLALLKSLEGPKSPGLPSHHRSSLQDIADAGSLPTTSAEGRVEIDHLRRWTTESNPTVREQMLERLRAGDALPAPVLEALAEHPGLLAAAGIDKARMLKSVLGTVRQRATVGTNDALAELELARSLARDIRPDDAAQQLARQNLLELLERNIERLDWRRPGGYRNYVDFSELGAATNAGDLLVALRTKAAAHASDTLRW
jgi:hypothetical protein